MISIIGVCIVIVIGLQAATLHRVNFESNDNEGFQLRSSASVQLPLQDELRQRFPGMFQTEAEIMKRVRLWINSTEAAANTIADALTKECVAHYCKIVLLELHTPCCKIETSFLAPTTAINEKENKTRTLTQFNGIRQFFYTENITKIYHPLFVKCQCEALPLYSSAVYDVEGASKTYEIGTFIIGTVCHNLSV